MFPSAFDLNFIRRVKTRIAPGQADGSNLQRLYIVDRSESYSIARHDHLN